MATVGNTFYGLSDYLSRTKADGSAAAVSNILYKMKPVLDNIMYTECNAVNKHETYFTTNLPTAQTIQAGGGVPLDKSNYSHVTEITAAVGLGHKVKEDVLKASGNAVEFRAQDARNCIEGVASKMEALFMEGDTSSDPLAFNGLKTRLNGVSGQLVDRVLKGANTDASVNTSVYFVVSGPRLTYGLHPSTFPMGIEAKLGTTAYPETNANGRVSYVYTDSWTLHGGLCIEDPRSVARLCNISVTKLKAGSGDDDLFGMLYDGYAAVKKVLGFSGARPMIIANPTLVKYLEKQARGNVTFSDLSIESREGVKITTYKGIPILESDYITNTEAVVS